MRARPEGIPALISLIARAWGDTLFETRGFTGPDGLHSMSSAYREIGLFFDLPADAH